MAKRKTRAMARAIRPWKMFALVVVLLLPAGLGAQTQAPTTRPANPPRAAARSQLAAPTKMVLEPRAMELLKVASERLAAAKSMSFTAVASYEYPSQLGPPILYSVRYDVLMRRPDKLRIMIPGDGPASEFYYDGKSIMAFAPAENLVAIADAPPTIEGALRQAFQTADLFYPFTDLVVADPYAAMVDGAILAFYIGPSGIVGGTKTEMVAWANPDVFLQIWIGGDDKLPRRVRAVYSADPLALHHQLDISDWHLDGDIPTESFASEKARAAQPMKFARPAATATPAGARPLGSPRPATGRPAQPATRSP